ncbi:MAG: O-antigen ligase family protein [Kiritimatiellia bacterium]
MTPIRLDANLAAQEASTRISAFLPDNSFCTNWFALTRSQTGTMRFLLLCTAGFGAWAIMRRTTQKSRQRWLIALLLLGGAAAIAGILGKWVYPQGDTLYWFIPVQHGRPGPMGGFMNRNHFGGFLAILAPSALCLAAIAINNRRPFSALLAFGTTALLAAGTLLSLSRGGTLALIAGFLACTATILIRSDHKSKICVLAALILLTAIGTYAIFQIPALRARMTDWDSPATREAATVRWTAWQDTLAIARAYPMLGAGPNAFRTVYPQHRLTSDRAARDFAENEYAQWLAETGLTGLLLALAFASILFRQIYRQCKRPPNPNTTALAPAAIGALAAAAMHATLDFPLRLPLYAITLAAISALLWPAPSQTETNDLRPNATHTTAIAIGLLFALLSLPANLQLDAPGTITAAPPAMAMRALHAAPTYPIVWRRLAATLWQHPDPEAHAYAVALLTQAAEYDPNNYILWRTLGERRQAIGDNTGANAAYHRVRELRDWVRVPTLPEDP